MPLQFLKPAIGRDCHLDSLRSLGMTIGRVAPLRMSTSLEEKPTKPKRSSVFRWRGVFALAFLLGGALLFWIVMGDRILAGTIREAATKALGTQVDLERAHIDLVNASVELRGLAVANPFDSTRNLVEVPLTRVVLDPEAALVNKIVIRELTIGGVLADTRRTTPAQRPKADGFAQHALTTAQQWRAQFNVPLLSLTSLDTVKSLALDPTQLRTVKEAQALATRVDSAKSNLVTKVQSLRLRETADSAEALLARLKGQTPRTLGLVGTRNAVADVRRIAARVDSTKKAIENLKTAAVSSVDSLVAQARAVDEARTSDYAFARGLLKLPTFDAPSIGPALFGNVSIDAVQKALYWITLARDYAPPGLLPRETPGPKRFRRAGTTVTFVTPTSYPRFALERGSFSMSLTQSLGLAGGAYRLEVRDVTSEPALVGRPTRFAFTRTTSGTSADSLVVAGLIDHTKSVPREVVDLRAWGLSLPSFAVPATPLRLELGRGASTFHFTSAGDAITGRWTVRAPSVKWNADSARLQSAKMLERLVVDVLRGIGDISVDAAVGGSLRHPTLGVQSNLDRAVADNIKRVAGEQIAVAEAKIRAHVDEEAERALAPVRERIAAARTDAEQRVKEASDRLEKAKSDLATQLKTLSAGLLGA